MTKVTLHKVSRPRPRGRPRHVWMLRYYDSAGKRCGKTLGDCKQMSKRDAEAIRREKQGRFDCNVEKPDKPTRMTLAAFAAYDREAIADRRYKTLLGHDQALGHAKRIIGADTRASSIVRSHVARLKAAMRDECYRPATIDMVIRVLRAAWNRGIKEGLVTDNPFADNGVKWEPRTARIFTCEEIEAMVVVADEWWRLFIRVVVTTGLRKLEAAHLRWSDVDLDAGTLRVTRHEAGRFTVDGQSYPLLEWSAKAKASYRTIPLADEVVAELRRYKARAGKSAYVFLDLDRLAALDARIQAGTLRPNFEPINNLLRGFQTIERQARTLLAERRDVAVDEVAWPMGCIHDLRDTYLTGVKDLPIDVLQRVAGHADISTTIRFYTSATVRDADTVRKSLAASGLAGSGHTQDTLADSGTGTDGAVARKRGWRYHEDDCPRSSVG